MGQFSGVTAKAKDTLLTIAAAHASSQGEETFWLAGGDERRALLGCAADDYRAVAVSADANHYLSLDRQGFIDVTDSDPVTFCVRQTLFAYAAYAKRSPFARWWIDLWYELTQGKSATLGIARWAVAIGAGAVIGQVVEHWVF